MTCNLTTEDAAEAPASLMALPDELLRKIASFSQLFASAPALVVAIGRHGGAKPAAMRKQQRAQCAELRRSRVVERKLHAIGQRQCCCRS